MGFKWACYKPTSFMKGKTMDDPKAIEERFAEMVRPVAKEQGLDLICVEFVKESGNRYLRAYLDKPDGDVSINDCTMVSRVISKKLDKDDFIEEAYTLEVCSKGFMEPDKDN